MSLSDLAVIAGEILIIGGALAMIVFLGISIYILTLVRKIQKTMNTISSGFDAVKEVAGLPLMMLSAFLAKKTSKK